MATKTLNTRIQNKYDSESKWNAKTSFIPLEGEMIIYAADADNSSPRIKFGDGETAVTSLPFAGGSSTDGELTKITSSPSQSGTLTYTGATQEPTWSNYDTSKMYISGVTSATNAGSYTAKFVPLTGYCWSDGTTTAKSVTWKINKATGTLTLSETSVGLPISTATKTVTIVTDSDGTITASSNATSVVTAEVFGKSVILTKVGSGDATVTVSLAAGTNYTAASATIAVTTDNTLEGMSWADIRSISASGQAANYFAVGDTKTITLNGQVGTEGSGLTLSNQSYKVFVLGIDHNSTKEGTGIHFGGFKTTSGTQICLCDDVYHEDGYSDDSSIYCFNMNLAYDNSGGWNSCRMRYNLLGSTDSSGEDASLNTATNPVSNSLMAALPADLRAVMQPMTKYTDNTGGGTDDSSYVTATVDFLPLLAAYEVFGSQSYANSGEQSYQAQYAYFANGNSKVFYDSQDDSSTAYWWLRSPCYNNSSYFCSVTINGTAGSYYANYSFGVAPAFKV